MSGSNVHLPKKSKNTQLITNSSTFIVPEGVSEVQVIARGPGGRYGWVQTQSSPTPAYTRISCPDTVPKTIYLSTNPGETLTITIDDSKTQIQGTLDNFIAAKEYDLNRGPIDQTSTAPQTMNFIEQSRDGSNYGRLNPYGISEKLTTGSTFDPGGDPPTQNKTNGALLIIW